MIVPMFENIVSLLLDAFIDSVIRTRKSCYRWYLPFRVTTANGHTDPLNGHTDRDARLDFRPGFGQIVRVRVTLSQSRLK